MGGVKVQCKRQNTIRINKVLHKALPHSRASHFGKLSQVFLVSCGAQRQATSEM